MMQTKATLEILKLDRAAQAPLYRQIYERFRTAIEQGMLKPGDRLASVRSLAAELGVARGTIEAAYNQLTGEGYFQARGQAGTVVSPHLAHHLPHSPGARHLSEKGGMGPGTVPTAARHGARGRRRGAASQVLIDRNAPARQEDAGDSALLPGSQPPLPFQLGIPALDAFPRKLWTRLAMRRVRATTAADMFYGDPCGYGPLRQALAAYLLVSRGIACRPAQIFVTAGYRASLALIAHTLLRRGAQVWVEDPGYPPAQDVLARAGQCIVPVPVDQDGLLVAQGMRQAPKAQMALVTPSHQAPLGVSMTLSRRLQLLDWASHARAWIVEDDYDGEYRYSGAPLPALKSLDAHDRVLYAGSFSKVLYPGLALAYVVMPAAVVERCGEAARAWSNGCPQLIQAIVADFLAQGHFSRHVKKMRLLYARRREILAAELSKVFGAAISIDLQSGGMHLIMRFHGSAQGRRADGHGRAGNDREMARRARQAGLSCQPLSERCVGHVGGAALLLGFTNVGSAAEARQLALRLRAAISGRRAAAT